MWKITVPALCAALFLQTGGAWGHEMQSPADPPQPAAETAGEERPYQERLMVNASLLFGSQFMQDSGWGDSGSGGFSAGALALDLYKPSWPVGLFASAGGASRDNGDYSISSLAIGPRFYLSRNGAVSPYLGAGVAFLSISGGEGYRRASMSSQKATGVFAGAGAVFRLGKYFHVGLDAMVVAGGGMDRAQNSNHIRLGMFLGAGSPQPGE